MRPEYGDGSDWHAPHESDVPGMGGTAKLVWLWHPDRSSLRSQAILLFGIRHRLPAASPGTCPWQIGFDFSASRGIIVSVLAGADLYLWSEGIYWSLGETA